MPNVCKKDKELKEVALFLQSNVTSSQLGPVLRAALDAAINSSITGRYRIDDLQQSEKTAIGTQVEIAFRNLLEVDRGQVLDLLIGNTEVDVKWSTGNESGPGKSWMLPTEAFGRIVCLITAWDTPSGSYFSLGLLRANKNARNLTAPNKDKKRGLLKATREKQVWWLFENEEMPGNVLMGLTAFEREQVLSEPAGEARMVSALRFLSAITNDQMKLLDVPEPHRRFTEVQEKMKVHGHSVALRPDGSWESVPFS